MPAHARARSGQEQQGIGVVGRSDHGRLEYTGRLAFRPRRTARPMADGPTRSGLDSQPEILDLLAHQFGGVTAPSFDCHHLDDVFVAEPDD